jgi:hypothetical protein
MKSNPTMTNVEPFPIRVNGTGKPSCLYDDSDGRIVWNKPVKEGKTVPVELANFKARIISDINRDDGVETTRHYEIAATLGRRPFRFTVPAAQFGSLRWVAEHMGANAVVAPGQGMASRLAHAIQMLSADGIEERHIYGHTGWREIDGAMYFLHAGGALGAKGYRIDIDVELPPQLARYDLHAPENDEDAKRAVRETLLLLHLAPARVMATMLGAAFRAPLGTSDITAALFGPTGFGKTEVSAIIEQHFGAGMDSRHLPLSWEHTANTIEHVLSVAKDVLVVVDEYVPGGNQAENAKLQAKAERVIRAQGNASGRGRMRADTTLRPVRPPRGQLVSTGEEAPTGQSLRARMMLVELRANEVDWQKVTAAQALAASGVYAMTMATFVMWMASRINDLCQEFQATRLELRKGIEAEHKRTADVVAQLAAAWDIFLLFAIDIGATDEAHANLIQQQVWAGLTEVAAEQRTLQQASDPVTRFRDLILAALNTGRAHVARADDGLAPQQAKRWGWQRTDVEWLPRGDCIGWIEDDNLYLEPDVSYAVASKIGSVGVSAETLSARMADKGVTVIEQGKRRRYRVRRTIKGGRPRVLHVRNLGWLFYSQSGTSGTSEP